jgi:hypothetical protein
MGPAAQGVLSVLSRQSLTVSRQTVTVFWDNVAIGILQRGRMGEDSRDIIGDSTVRVFLQSVVHGLSAATIYQSS